MYLNKVMLIGNLTRDPEIKALPSGIQVCTIGLATNRTWKDKNGAKQEDTQFHNVVAFGKQAELIAQYMRKGSSLYLEGRLQTRSWDDKDGQKKYRTEIVLDTFQFGPKTTGGGGASYSAPGASPASTQKAPTPAQELDTIQYPEEEINPDDIPF